MTTYTLTAEQSAALVARWNELANDSHQLDPTSAYLMLSDNFDDDMDRDGCAMIEVGRFSSKSRNPETFYVYEGEVTAEEAS